MERECLYQILNVNLHQSDAGQVNNLIQDLKYQKIPILENSPSQTETTYSRKKRPAKNHSMLSFKIIGDEEKGSTQHLKKYEMEERGFQATSLLL